MMAGPIREGLPGVQGPRVSDRRYSLRSPLSRDRRLVALIAVSLLVLVGAPLPAAAGSFAEQAPAVLDPSALGIDAVTDLPFARSGDGSIRIAARGSGSIYLEADGAPPGVAVAFSKPEGTGWRLDSAGAGWAIYAFGSTASTATVSVEFRDGQGSLLATIQRELALQRSGSIGTTPDGPLVLDWLEDAAGAAGRDRRLRIESAVPDPRLGCRDWQIVDEREIATFDTSDGAAPENVAFEDQAPEDLTAGDVSLATSGSSDKPATVAWTAFAATWFATLDQPSVTRATTILGDEVIRTATTSSTFVHGRLTIPFDTDGCRRFSIESVSADGKVVASGWPYIAPGRLALGKRVLPRFTAGRSDLYRSSAYVSQQTYLWCIAATSQMMVSLITGRPADDASQRYLMSYAKTHDRVDDYQYGGSDAQGGAAVLARFAGAAYERIWVANTDELMRTAALRMRLTGSPVETTVMDGHHAWVINGYDASVDPVLDGGASVSAVYVSGPLWPRSAQAGGFDPAPDTRVTESQLARYLSPSGRSGPWRLLVPIPGALGGAAQSPHSLAEVGLYAWPPNLFYAPRAITDSQPGAPVIDPEQPTITPTPGPSASPSASALPSGSLPTDTPLPSPTDTALPSPTDTATPGPTDTATPAPTDTATPAPTDPPTPVPTDPPTPDPTINSTPDATPSP